MSESNRELVNKLIEEDKAKGNTVHLTIGMLNAFTSDLKNNIDLTTDMFNNPISASIMGFKFPIGHAYLISKLIDKIDYFICFLEIKEFVDNKIKDLDNIINKSKEVINNLQELMNNLNSEDVGVSKGFNCIYDYGIAFDKITNDGLNPLIKKVNESFIK